MPEEKYLKELLSQQRKVTEELEKELTKYSSSDIIIENETLRSELTKCRARLEEADFSVAKLSEENRKLKSLLYEQIYNEKLAILNAVTRKADIYFQGNVNGEINRLKAFEFDSRRRIDEMTNILLSYRISSQDEIFMRLQELNGLLNYKVSEAMRLLNEQAMAFTQNRDAWYGQLQQEGVSEAEVQSALKKNNLESLIGLNIINKIGILFLIIGVIAVSQFTYYRLPELFKGIFIFLLGTVLLAAGELLNRRRPNVFSLGITSGGVAVLFAGVAISYFGLEIIGMYPALALCIAITALSFYLSQRYHSQTIATFSFIGGYLPILSISADKTLVYSAMVYFIILNLLSLILAFRRKWAVAAFVGFVFNVFGSVYIISLTIADASPADSIKFSDVLTVLYLTLAFLIYTLIPVISAYSARKKLAGADVVLLTFNTYISALLLYVVFFNTGFTHFKGLLAVIFAASYFAFGKWVGVKLPQEKKIRVLFYLTSFTFTVLIIPLQFDVMWLSLGWLVEGLLLLIYGIIKDEKNFRKFGYIANSLCLAAFLIADLLPHTIGIDTNFTYKYLSVTLGSLLICTAYIYRRKPIGYGVKALRYCSYINVWFFILYIILQELPALIKPMLEETSLDEEYLVRALCITAGFLLAYCMPRIKVISDIGIKIISMCIYSLSILWFLGLNSFGSVQDPYGAAGTSILIVLNILSLLAVMDLVKTFISEIKMGVEWYPLTVSVYFVLLLTQNLIMQYHLRFTNFIISIIYIILAFSWIVFGFVKKYSFIRRFGLGLSFMAVAKLFLIDLSFLTEGYRIISYFAFGIVLIAISFVYQYFSKRLETYPEMPPR